jgi:hypothetical protein
VYLSNSLNNFFVIKLAQYKIRASVSQIIHKYIYVSLFALFVSLFLFITSKFSFYFLYSLLVYFLCVYSSYLFCNSSLFFSLFVCIFLSLVRSCLSAADQVAISILWTITGTLHHIWNRVALNFKFTLRRYANVTWLGILYVHWFYFCGPPQEVMALAARNLCASLKGTGQNERRKYSHASIVASVITRSFEEGSYLLLNCNL